MVDCTDVVFTNSQLYPLAPHLAWIFSFCIKQSPNHAISTKKATQRVQSLSRGRARRSFHRSETTEAPKENLFNIGTGDVSEGFSNRRCLKHIRKLVSQQWINFVQEKIKSVQYFANNAWVNDSIKTKMPQSLPTTNNAEGVGVLPADKNIGIYRSSVLIHCKLRLSQKRHAASSTQQGSNLTSFASQPQVC